MLPFVFPDPCRTVVIENNEDESLDISVNLNSVGSSSGLFTAALLLTYPLNTVSKRLRVQGISACFPYHSLPNQPLGSPAAPVATATAIATAPHPSVPATSILHDAINIPVVAPAAAVTAPAQAQAQTGPVYPTYPHYRGTWDCIGKIVKLEGA